MTLIWNIIQSVITILEIRVCVWMMEKFAEPRYSGKKQKIVVWIVTLGVGVAYAVNRWMASYFSRVLIFTIVIILSIITIWLFVYHREIAILVMANYLLVSGLLDLAFMSMVELITQKAGMFAHIEYINDGCRIGVIVLSKSVLFFIFWIIEKKLNKSMFIQLAKKRFSVICLLLCAVEYIGVHILTAIVSVEHYITYDFLIRLIFCLIVVFLLIAIISIILLYYEKEDQLRVKNEYLKSLDYENQKLIKSYREREKMYHDFKNHLLVLDGFAHSKDFEQYESYMREIQRPFRQKPAERKIGHDIMDLILNHKVWEAEQQQIRVSCKVFGYMDYKPEISDEEACSLIGNLWDNAIEACQRFSKEESWIDFQMHIRPGKFIIEISNPYQEIWMGSGGELKTMKKDKKTHGIGVRVIQDITERYHGYFNYIVEDHVFRVEIMVYCNK